MVSRLLFLLFGCCLAAAALAAPPRIVMVLWRGETEVERGFRRHLAEQKADFRIDVFNLDKDLGRLPEAMARLRADPPDLVYTWGTSATLGVAGAWDAKKPEQFLQGVPILFTMVADPEETDIVPPPDMPPRRWVTGVSHIAPLAVQIRAIRSYLPLSKLGIVFNPLEANSRINVAALRQQARLQGFALLAAAVPIGRDGQPDATEIPRLVRDLAGRGAQLLYIGPDSFIGTHRDSLTAAGIANGLPCFSATELEVRKGEAMFGLVSRYDLVGRLTAAKALAILRERRSPDEIPVETLDRFTYLIRLPVAQRLKLYPPLPLLRYAEIIE
jgi:putative ABC transport system substrate-binding protein